MSLSARRAWIEMPKKVAVVVPSGVALRKESVDRNITRGQLPTPEPVALRKESVDRNCTVQVVIIVMNGRSPQGERG